MIDICLFLLLEQLKVVRVPTTIYITLTWEKSKNTGKNVKILLGQSFSILRAPHGIVSTFSEKYLPL